ncbi:MAG: methyltransferase domain-containing protein [Bacteroidales bacterium]|nr:methyltransferase domain-containing protein [Bacteroidales bacterium]
MTQSEVEFFDNLAPRWDNDEIRSTPERINAVLDLLSIRKGDKVLDLGTGTGVLLPYLSVRVGEEGEVTGVDLSEGMLSRAIEKYGNLGNVGFLRLDFEEENLTGEYDAVLLYSVFPHLHRPEATFGRLFERNVRPGGRVVVAFPSDERFINAIHEHRQAESGRLPSAPRLAELIRSWGYDADVAAYSEDIYVIIVSRPGC